MERVLSSRAFARSPRISRFLTFVINQTLEGQEDKLKEYLLGVEVFNRQESFDPRIDSIVRVEARRLRYKLEKYYETEGRSDGVYIQFRKGCYVPSFSTKRPLSEEVGADGVQVPYLHLIDNAHAFAQYAKGRYNLGRWTADGIAESVSCFSHALDEDPGCAAAQAGLASAWTLASVLGLMPARDVIPKAKTSAQRAISLAADCAEAHAISGFAAAVYDWEWNEAESTLLKAIQLNPCDISNRLWYGLYSMLAGHTEAAVHELHRVQQAAPTSITTHLGVGFACYLGHANDEALLQYRLAQDLEPSFYAPYLAMGLMLTDQQMFEQAMHLLQKARQLQPRNAFVVAALSYAHAAAGRSDAASQGFGELESIAQQQYVCPLTMAAAASQAGEPEIAMRKLTEAFEERSSWLAAVRLLPMFARIREDSRYPAMIERLHIA
jgi:tetratricopeptide (TPR) repeat protein